MKRFPTLLCLLAAAIFMSCNSSDKTNTTTTSDSTSASTDTSKTSMAPANTIDTAAQTVLMVIHRVKDFSKWLAAYEAHDSAKLSYGIHNYVVGRVVGDTNLVLVATKADDLAKAKAFASSASLKTAMQKSGVVGAPTIEFNTFVWQDTAKIASMPRSMVEYSVKDWATWKHVFDSTKSIREGSG
ncbi:MAG TPA: hypothetical protein VGC95_13295, partial [Chitinophagaceae bacterium]